MKEVIQFSDNLFYLSELIKTIATASELNMNSQLFGEKVAGDISFINGMLDRFTSLVAENPGHRSAPANLRLLLKARAAFKNALEALSGENSVLFAEQGDQTEYIRTTLNRQDEQVQVLIDLMNDLDQSENNEVFITSEEMNMLLKE